MWYFISIAAGFLIALFWREMLIRSKEKTERLQRELAEQKAKSVVREMAQMPLPDAVNRANQRWRAKFEQTKGPRRDDTE